MADLDISTRQKLDRRGVTRHAWADRLRPLLLAQQGVGCPGWFVVRSQLATYRLRLCTLYGIAQQAHWLYIACAGAAPQSFAGAAGWNWVNSCDTVANAT